MLEAIVLWVLVPMVIILNLWAFSNWAKHMLDPISRKSDYDHKHHHGGYPYLDK